MRNLFRQMKAPDHSAGPAPHIGRRCLQYEIGAIDRQRRIIASQPQRLAEMQREMIGQRDARDEADELVEAVDAPAGDGQREVELRMGGFDEHARRVRWIAYGGEGNQRLRPAGATCGALRAV